MNFDVKVYQTDRACVAAGLTDGGWCFGTLAGLPPGAAIDVVFDLGSDWRSYGALSLAFVIPAPNVAGLSGVVVYAVNGLMPTSSPWAVSRARWGVAARGAGAVANGATLVGTLQRPGMGRYVIVCCTNADGSNAVGATGSITLTANPA